MIGKDRARNAHGDVVTTEATPSGGIRVTVASTSGALSGDVLRERCDDVARDALPDGYMVHSVSKVGQVERGRNPIGSHLTVTYLRKATTYPEYVAARNISVRVTTNKGVQTNADGWQHHAYRVAIHFQSNGENGTGHGYRQFTTDYMMGMAHGDSRPDAVDVFAAVVGDAHMAEDHTDARDLAESFGMPMDTRAEIRKAETLYRKLSAQRDAVLKLVGGQAELDSLRELEGW